MAGGFYGVFEGMIVGTQIKKPKEGQKGEPCQVIQVLQSADGEKAELNDFKDYNLQERYEVGKDFKAMCRISSYAFSGEFGSVNGMSTRILQRIAVDAKKGSGKINV